MKCGLVFVSEPPSTAAIGDYYASGSFSRTARGGTEPTRAQLEASEKRALERYRHIARHMDLALVEPKRSLDVGAGAGAFVRLARGAGFEALGLEPDPMYAATAEARYGLAVLPKPLEDHEIERASLGLVTAFHVLEHIAAPRDFLSRLRAGLAPEGVLWLEVPSLDRAYGGDLDRFFWAPHLVSYSKATLAALLGAQGFEVVHSAEMGDFLEMAARPGEIVPFDGADDPVERLRLLRGLRRRYAARVVAQQGRRLLRRGKGLARGVIKATRSRSLGAPGDGTAGSLARVVHVAPHSAGNAGDVVLVDGVQRVLDAAMGRRGWHEWDLGRQMGAEDVATINRETSGVVVGGGGLFLRDTHENDRSGWQWQIDRSSLEQLQVPLIVFAVGYNRFRGHDDFAPVFEDHVAATVERASFFGLRNNGSIAALSRHLPAHLAERLRYQPCPTTVIARWAPDVAGQPAEEEVVVLNPAFDRPNLRFGGKEHEICKAMARVAAGLASEGYTIELAIHSRLDATIIPWLDRARVPYTEHRLEAQAPDAVLRYYARAGLVVGMRGHSQMIPFGLGRPIVSVVSHPKLGWFLDDIGHPEWGVDVESENFEDELRDVVRAVQIDRRSVERSITRQHDRLWAITAENVSTIAEVMA